MPIQNGYARKLRFEGLEDRTLMAGDVTVAVVSGVLQIVGDIADNSIQIKQSGKVWQVQGVDTTVNGNNSAQSFTGVTGIDINLGAGNDSINASQGKLRAGTFQIRDDGGSTVVNLLKIAARGIDVRTHDGSDTITLDKCEAESIGIFTSPQTGDDEADVVTILNSAFKGQPTVYTGGGNDVVTINAVVAGGACIVRTFTPGESDQDSVTMTKFRSKFALLIETGDGPDTITLTDVHSKEDDIRVLASETAADSSIDGVVISKLTAEEGLQVVTGDGADVVTLEKCNVDYRIDISTAGTSADGSDFVRLTQIKSGESIVIETGDGTDEVNLTQLVAGEAIGVHMGGGDSDQLVLEDSRALGALLLGSDGAGDEVTLNRNKWKRNILNLVGFELQYG